MNQQKQMNNIIAILDTLITNLIVKSNVKQKIQVTNMLHSNRYNSKRKENSFRNKHLSETFKLGMNYDDFKNKRAKAYDRGEGDYNTPINELRQ